MLEDDAFSAFYFLALRRVWNNGPLGISVKKRKAFRGEGLSGEDVGAIGTCIQPNAPLKASLLMNKDCIRWVFSLRICNIYHGPSAQSLNDFGRRKNVAQALRTDD